MLELIQITNDPAFARRCDALGGFRLFVDLERMGKAERQAGRDTFISTHAMEDVGRIRAVLTRSRLMVRVNPLHAESAQEIDAVLAQRPDLLMLPMFHDAAELREFTRQVDGRVPVVALLETARALDSLDDWLGVPGLEEVFIGLNDLHLSLGQRFMFLPLARGLVEDVARRVREAGLRFGFGGIARMHEGLLPGVDVLAEHVRLGSSSVILSRTFHRSGAMSEFEDEIQALRREEARLGRRGAAEMAADATRIAALIERIAAAAAPAA